MFVKSQTTTQHYYETINNSLVFPDGGERTDSN